MRELHYIHDGDQGPGYRLHLDLGSGFDLSNASVVCYIVDSAGTNIASRPGVIYGTKADRNVDVLMRGKETDWDGAGKELFLVPRIYKALSPTRTPATNLLLNPSFDTYTGGTGIADSWTLSGSIADMVYEVRQDDPAPPVIFGKCQRSYSPIAGTTIAYIGQLPAVTLVPGDYISGGVWYRAKIDTGGANAGSEHYMTVHAGAESVKVNFPLTDTDWTFVPGEASIKTAASSSGLQLVTFDLEGYEIRFDDAFLFKGRWSVYHTETYSLKVRRRPRPLKTNFVNANFILGIGGFEIDSNADGLADGWGKTGSTNTYSMEVDPDHVNVALGGLAAQTIVLNGATTDQLRLICRGHFKAGETWKFIVAYKNSGALGGSPANGDFGIVLHTEEFDGTYEQSSLAGANFSMSSVASYANKNRTLALTSDHSVLVLDINLKTASGGTLWLDDAVLIRSA